MRTFNHIPRQVGHAVQERIDALKIGQKMQDLPEHLWHKSFRFYVKEDATRRGGPNLRMIRLDPNKPSLTVTGYIFNKFVHPFENRFITPREAARLQGFPDDLEFKGALGSTQLQIGNAVPLFLGKAVFESILTHAKKLEPRRRIFNALSLFSGAGGLDIAAYNARHQNARLRTFASIELDKDSCNTLQAYLGHETKVINDSVYSFPMPESIGESLGITKNQVDLVYGGPPCQAFSQAGKQRGVDDPRGQLIGEFLRYIESIQPRYFVMENVQGLAGVSNGKLLQNILQEMNHLGFNVNWGLLNAADYGAPQLRKRLIFIGTRNEYESAHLPSATHSAGLSLLANHVYKTVGEAFVGLPICESEETIQTQLALT